MGRGGSGSARSRASASATPHEDSVEDVTDQHELPPGPDAPRKFARGAITRVGMHNFLTYSDCNFAVGPRLNIIVGPNGSGKSSIVCALALALAGNPKILGRGDKLDSFIMHQEVHSGS